MNDMDNSEGDNLALSKELIELKERFDAMESIAQHDQQQLIEMAALVAKLETALAAQQWRPGSETPAPDWYQTVSELEHRGSVAALAPTEAVETMNDMDNSEGGINPREAMLWAEIAAAAAAVAADHRDEGARALADEWAALATLRATVAMAVAQASIAASQASIAASWAAIASALYDDDDNNLTHIAHNMSYQLAVIARNTGAIDDEGDEGDEDMPTLDAPGAHSFIVGGNLPY